MRVTLEKAPVGTRGTLVEEIWRVPAGALVEVTATPWDKMQEMQVRVQLVGQGYHKDLPYYVEIDISEPVDYTGPVQLKDVLGPIVRRLLEKGMSENAIPHELYEEAIRILDEKKGTNDV